MMRKTNALLAAVAVWGMVAQDAGAAQGGCPAGGVNVEVAVTASRQKTKTKQVADAGLKDPDGEGFPLQNVLATTATGRDTMATPSINVGYTFVCGGLYITPHLGVEKTLNSSKQECRQTVVTQIDPVDQPASNVHSSVAYKTRYGIRYFGGARIEYAVTPQVTVGILGQVGVRSSTTQTTSELAVTEVAMRLPKGVVSRKDKVRKMFWRLQLISSYYFTPNAYVRFGIGLSTATGGKQTKKDNPIEVKGKAAFELSMGVGVTV